jgi:hypothetical protein
MRRLAFLSAFILLAACTNTEGNIESAKKKMEKAHVLINSNPLDSEAFKILRDAEEIVGNLEVEPLYFIEGKVCSQIQLPFDAENLNLKARTIRYEIDFAKAEREFSKQSVEYNLNLSDPDNYLYLYGLYKEHADDTRKMISGEDIAKKCREIGVNVVYKEEYKISLEDHEEVSKKIAAQYEKKTGLKFSDAIDKQKHYEFESRRRQNWDAMSPIEKDVAAGGRKDVKECLDAALTDNKQATKISNVVSDAATLCRNGLQ